MPVLPLALALTICDPVVSPVEDPFGEARIDGETAWSEPSLQRGGARTLPAPPAGTDDVFQPVAARGLHAAPGEPRDQSKRQRWFRDKVLRPDRRVSDAMLKAGQRQSAQQLRGDRQRARSGRRQTERKSEAVVTLRPGLRLEPITTLFNVWTREALPILPGDAVAPRLHSFLRDHYTNQATQMDTRLLDVLTGAARKFSARRIEVVSGYRSPKYNLMLRKKGHQVARSSQHVEGHAVDFRIRGVPTRTLLRYVRSLRLGGVGFYPNSQFVHSDTGRIRYWTGS